MPQNLHGTLAQLHDERREEQSERTCATGTGSGGLVTGTELTCRSVGGQSKALGGMNEDYISIRCPDQNKTTLQLVFNAPLGDFKDEFLDDRGSAPPNVHLRHRHLPYYAGASLPSGQWATLQERPQQLLAIHYVKRHPRPSG